MKREFCISIVIAVIGLGFILICLRKADRPTVPVKVNQPIAPEKENQPATPMKTDQPAPIVTARDILQAHNAWRRTKAIATYYAKVVKLTSVSNPGNEMPSSLEQKMQVSVKGNAFKRYREFPQGIRKEHHTFDGRTAYQLVIEKGRTEEGVSQMSPSELASVGYGIRSFGLLPFLNQLADPVAELIYLKRTAHGDDKIKVTTPAASFILYVNSRHVIQCVEIGTKRIEFWDYDVVNKILLPFTQRVYVKNQLSYELIFKKIRLNLSFSDNYFTREAISKNIAF
ncbi:MAG: hypothetical protein WBV94_03280 [Blastocatellia bacterium]